MKNLFDWFLEIILLILIAVLLLLIWQTKAKADSIIIEAPVLAIIGEAEGEGYRGMLAVACAIRNRGTLQGVYGLRAPRVVKHLYSNKTLELARKAWKISKIRDITKGATHWEGTAFRKPYWAQRMVLTITIGNQRFYKEAK